jgi:nitrogen regulatory protein P-II 1
MRGETSTFLYSKRPFDIDHLPESVKLEVVCPEESVDKTVKLITQVARAGDPGDGIIAVHDVERVMKIRDIERA